MDEVAESSTGGELEPTCCELGSRRRDRVLGGGVYSSGKRKPAVHSTIGGDALAQESVLAWG